VRRLAFVAFCLIVLQALPADSHDGKAGYVRLRQVLVTPLDCSGLCQGVLIDWANGRSQVRIDFAPDVVTPDNNASAPEWQVEVYATPCGARKTYPIYQAAAVNDPTYGVRLHEFATPHLLAQVPNGSVWLLHDGPTPTRHAAAAGYSGRHVLGCVPTS
jgi:hypothetical protein